MTRTKISIFGFLAALCLTPAWAAEEEAFNPPPVPPGYETEKALIADFTAGEKVGNHVHPDDLSEREKDILVDSLKAIDNLRKRVNAEFTGELF